MGQFILAIGQSNMVGLNDGSTITPDTYIKQMSRGLSYGYTAGSDLDIIGAQNQLQHASQNTANGPTPAGPAIEYVQGVRPTATSDFLIVPAAVGGTGFTNNYWAKGQSAYDDAYDRAALAISLGWTFHSIIWIQGEADKANLSYSSQLMQMIDDLRTDFGNVPFLAATIIEGGADEIATNDVILQTLRQRILTGFVDATDLTSGNFGVHYSAANITTIASRFVTAYSEAVVKYFLPTHPNLFAGFFQNVGISIGATFEWRGRGVSGPSTSFTQSDAGKQPTNGRTAGIVFTEGQYLSIPSDVPVAAGYTKIIRFKSTDLLTKVNYLFQTVDGMTLRIGGGKLRFGTPSNVNAAAGSTTLSQNVEYTVAITHTSAGEITIYLGSTVEATGSSPVAQGGEARVSWGTAANLYGLSGSVSAVLLFDKVLTIAEITSEISKIDTDPVDPDPPDSPVYPTLPEIVSAIESLLAANTRDIVGVVQVRVSGG